MIIKILGSGCPSCQKLEQNVKKAIEELDLNNIQIEKVTDYEKMSAYGIMSVPALVIDEQVKAYGQVLTVEQIKKLLGYV
ncbi:MAG: thioredoxin family protein [Patescibacteria group bacterium]